jgi:hypothetical protein
MRRRSLLAAPLAFAACGPLPPRQDQLTLPDSAEPQGLGDPTRGAIIAASYAFNVPASVAGNSAAGATALAQLEYLAVEIAVGSRWIGMDPLVAPLLAEGRAEARGAFGISAAVPPQQAVDALYAAAAALRGGDSGAAATALAPLGGPGGTDALLARLAAMPYLPRAAFATAAAQNGMNRMDRDRIGRWPW